MTDRAFWDAKHAAGDQYWLTGSTLEQLVRAYNLDLVPSMNVTEIGVGTGSCTRGLVAAGQHVAAVDISFRALDNVRGLADRVYHVFGLNNAPPADLALCHLVFQHVADEMVEWILAETKLAPGGVFAFQTAWMVSPMKGLTEDAHGLIWHDADSVRRMAVQAGLEVYWEREETYWAKGDEVRWGLFKARRRP